MPDELSDQMLVNIRFYRKVYEAVKAGSTLGNAEFFLKVGMAHLNLPSKNNEPLARRPC